MLALGSHAVQYVHTYSLVKYGPIHTCTVHIHTYACVCWGSAQDGDSSLSVCHVDPLNWLYMQIRH